MDELIAALDKAVAEGNWKLGVALGLIVALLASAQRIKAIARKRAAKKAPKLEIVEKPADRQDP